MSTPDPVGVVIPVEELQPNDHLHPARIVTPSVAEATRSLIDKSQANNIYRRAGADDIRRIFLHGRMVKVISQAETAVDVPRGTLVAVIRQRQPMSLENISCYYCDPASATPAVAYNSEQTSVCETHLTRRGSR